MAYDPRQIAGNCLDAFNGCAVAQNAHFYPDIGRLLVGLATFFIANGVARNSLIPNALVRVPAAAFLAVFTGHLLVDHTPNGNETQAAFSNQMSESWHDTWRNAGSIVGFFGTVGSDFGNWVATPHPTFNSNQDRSQPYQPNAPR